MKIFRSEEKIPYMMNCTPFVRQYGILNNWAWYNKVDMKLREIGERKSTL